MLIKLIKIFLFLILPNKLKILILRSSGATIGNNVKIGMSIILADNVTIGDNVLIGNFNLIWRLKVLKLESGSRIHALNWITGGRKGSFILGANSSVSVSHYLEASGGIVIGENTIVAGRSSQFFTHGITPSNLNKTDSIRIGNWCYVGSASKFTPGSELSNYCFLGMGTVVTKKFTNEYKLIAGVPAREIKDIPKDSIFFNRDFMPHSHHPK